MTALFPDPQRTAMFSDDRAYRYDLVHRWEPDGPLALWIMLNPSTADEHTDDPTVRRCWSFARREGLTGAVVVNLYAWRSTDPDGLLDAADPIGPANPWMLRRWLADPDVVIVCAAWGAHVDRLTRRGLAAPPDIARYAHTAGRGLLCLGTTSTGAPRHPLYVKGDAPLRPLDLQVG